MNWIHGKLALALVVAAGAVSVPGSGTAHAGEAEQQQNNRTKVELELAAGKSTIKFLPKTLKLGERGIFEVEQDDHRHVLQARVERTGDGGRFKVVLDYRRDDETIVEGAQVEMALGGRATTRPVGKSKIKVRVSKGEPDSHRIDMPDGDDPLTGL